MPSSSRKIESARANGAKSSGPATDQGRQAVALNAVKHGLSAQTVILRSESPEEYQAELQDYLEHFRPQGPSEMHLVHQVAAAGWRLARYAGVESALLDNKMDEQAEFVDEEYPGISNKQRLAIAFDALAASSPSLALVNRYESRLHHEYQRILKSLLQLQTARHAAEAKLPNKPNPTSEHPSAEAEVVPIAAGKPLTIVSPERTEGTARDLSSEGKGHLAHRYQRTIGTTTQRADHLPVFLHALSFAIASRFNSVRNSAFAGIGSADLRPSSSRASSRSFAPRFLSSRPCPST